MRLSPRLAGVLELVPVISPVADVGSGHGRLAAALAARGQAVVATERTPAMRARLIRDLERVGGKTMETRLGDGLGPLLPGEVGTVVIAGLGGRSLVRILDSATWLPRHLVLQPMPDVAVVEAWISRRGWPARESRIVERGRFYRAWRVEVPEAIAVAPAA